MMNPSSGPVAVIAGVSIGSFVSNTMVASASSECTRSRVTEAGWASSATRLPTSGFRSDASLKSRSMPNCIELAQQIIAKGLSVRDAERLAQQKKAKRFKQPKAPKEKDADTKALERDLTAKLAILAEAHAARNYTELKAVQKAVLDPALACRDLRVTSQTGSGKTVAFGLAMAHQIGVVDGLFGANPQWDPH